MARIIIYSLLFCLIVLVAYGRFIQPRPPEEPAIGASAHEATVQPAPATVPWPEEIASLPDLPPPPEPSPALAVQDRAIRE